MLLALFEIFEVLRSYDLQNFQKLVVFADLIDIDRNTVFARTMRKTWWTPEEMLLLLVIVTIRKGK